MKKFSSVILFFAIVTLIMGGCTSLDCSTNNIVALNLKLAGEVDTLKADTLSIYTTRIDGTDTLLFNRGNNVSSFSLPMSYSNNTDVYAFLLKDTLQREYKDTLLIEKNSQIHIESVDCSPQYFHHIIGVQYTRNSIDSIVINNPNVNNDATKQHLLIYFKHNI